jgi:hypothetical protein
MAVTLAPTHLPHVQVITTETSGICTQVNLPTLTHLALNLHNRDKATKNAMVSFDQTLTDGGAAPATGGWTIDDYLNYNINGNGANGAARITKLFLFSPSHNSVVIELLLQTAKPAN